MSVIHPCSGILRIDQGVVFKGSNPTISERFQFETSVEFAALDDCFICEVWDVIVRVVGHMVELGTCWGGFT